MKLIDLLSIIDENTPVNVCYASVVNQYDGRNSIPNELNDREVVEVTAYVSNRFTPSAAVIEVWIKEV